MEYFQDPATQRFSFTSRAAGLDKTTFAVLRFKGHEAISTPYEFEIMLVSGEAELNLADILQSQAVLTIHRESGDDVAYNGIIAEFDQLHAYNGHFFYRAKLVPKLWWLMQTRHNQVFLEQTVPEIIEGALVDGGMDSLDYDLGALEGRYDPIEYVCQYDESHFNFVSRWLEREGIYYYFYHDIDGDKLVLSDSSFSHEPLLQGADLIYSPLTGMEQGHRDEILLNFTCRQKQLPNRIVLKDHNPERPSLEMAVRVDVDPDGRGESYLYGEHYNTPEEGERLAAFRAEELLCQKQAFHGDSTVPFLAPGFKFNLHQHYRASFNQEYMVLGVTHEGDQSNLLKTSVIGSLGENPDINIYSNSFTAIPAERQYRHPRQTDKPRISGTLHGKIDGEQESPYAQLDEQGRYKVRLPFDINDEHIDGKASARVRMMQPYAGEQKGMQFPLTKGTEVLLTFIDGNPDRPVIAGAVSTETAPSPVNANNQSESVIRSGGNNRIRMEDKAGSERLVMQSPKANSWIRAGAPNDPPSLNVSSPQLHQEGDTWKDPGATITREADDGPETVPVDCLWLRAESEVNDLDPVTDHQDTELPTGKYIARYKNSETAETVDLSVWSLDIHDSNHEFLRERHEGIMLHTDGSYWLEANNRYAEYTHSYPRDRVPSARPDPQVDPATLNQILFKFTGDGSSTPDYKPTGMLDYLDKSTEYDDFHDEVLSRANVRLSSYDTVTTQEGNIYDFGGYWNYNLGNSYEEAHVDQQAVLNELRDEDLLPAAGPDWRKTSDDPGLRWPNTSGGTGMGDTNLSSDNTSIDEDDFLSGNVWTTKQFGHSYDLHIGDAISVSKGNSLDVSYTGSRSVEVKLRHDMDAPAYYSKSEGGKNWERKWDKGGQLIYDGYTEDKEYALLQTETHYNRGAQGIANYSSSTSTGQGKAEFEFDYSNTVSSKITASSSLAFNLNMAGSIEVNANLAASVNISGSAFNLDVNGHLVAIETKLNNLETEINVVGCKLRTYKGMTLQTENMRLEQLGLDLKSLQTNVEAGSIDLKSKMLTIFS